MIEFLSSADDVLALRFEGSLSDAELRSVTTRLEAMLAAHEKTHVYVKGVHFGGIEATALARYLPHAAGFLKHRKRFGRVAVVSDQDWVRFLTKLESALLPDISYETFRMDESEQARRWVDGEAKLPHGSKFKIIETDKPEVTGFEISGKISAAEMGAVADHYNAILSQRRPIRLLARMTNYAGAALGALADLDYLKMKLGMLKDLERYAVVGGPDWMRFAVEGLGPMFKMEIRHFPGDQEMAAWKWLGASPVRRTRHSGVKVPIAFCGAATSYVCLVSAARYAWTRAWVVHRGVRPLLRSATKRGSPTASRPNLLAERCVCLR